MEEIIECLRDTGFPQPLSLVNLLYKPSQDRNDIIKWCLSEIDENLGIKLGNVRSDEELKKQLPTITRKLGLTSENDSDVVLGFGDQEHQTQFWLKLLKVVKCVQVRNRLSPEQRLKKTPNTSNLWCAHLQNSKHKESLKTKLNLIAPKWRIEAQQEPTSLASIVKDKDSLLQQLLAMKLDSQDSLHDEDGLGQCDTIHNVSAADLKALVANMKEITTRSNLLCQDVLKSQTQRHHHQAQNKEAMALEDNIQRVSKQVNALSQTVSVTETIVEGFEAVVDLQCENKFGNIERLQNEVLECLYILDKTEN